MGYSTYSEKLESLVYFVKSRSATNVNELTRKLEVSRRTVLRMIDALRVKGINIQYSYKDKKYFIED
ncbi:MAG: HTH domain-containing protein [Bacteroidia bacterium]